MKILLIGLISIFAFEVQAQLSDETAQVRKVLETYKQAIESLDTTGTGQLFGPQSRRWAIVGLILLGAAYSVVHAGHYGAQLVHIEGGGPQGKFLKLEYGH